MKKLLMAAAVVAGSVMPGVAMAYRGDHWAGNFADYTSFAQRHALVELAQTRLFDDHWKRESGLLFMYEAMGDTISDDDMVRGVVRSICRTPKAEIKDGDHIAALCDILIQD